MTYRIIVTERANELIDSHIYYIYNILKNPNATGHLLDMIEDIYNRLEETPFQFADSKDGFLKSCGYKEAFVSEMDYKLIFRVDDKIIYVVGFFHNLEDYTTKVFE
ncbi:type II toxin-antitoxin system RelE/ParE family toxin [Butyrivibrio sp. AE2005]|uniref:type II toxin-antitoxin system RelE/ParE family toxin n=1 Tax=Butyrivibrio sp. AE2005 TaxID=1496722 RepID=UPI0004787DA5|nr:hypothetical protein [Butyrivibrio sp. AE2005]